MRLLQDIAQRRQQLLCNLQHLWQPRGAAKVRVAYAAMQCCWPPRRRRGRAQLCCKVRQQEVAGREERAPACDVVWQGGSIW